MTRAEWHAALQWLAISDREFAELTGTNVRTVRRWSAGIQDIPPWVPVMLELMTYINETAGVSRLRRLMKGTPDA